MDLRSLERDGVLTSNLRYRITNLFGDVEANAPGPQVFRVEQGAGQTTAPHYHAVPQFQVLDGRPGRFGRAEVSAPTIHYADPWTTYGPIVGGDAGLSYFTARMASDTGAHFMPESRHEKPQRSGRHFTVSLAPADAGEAQEGAVLDVLIEAQPDGLAAYRVRLAPGNGIELPACTGIGRLVAVVSGSLVDAGREFGLWSWGYAATVDDRAISAGSDGATVLCLDYPAAGAQATPRSAA
ncbi:MAG: hypothetical protein EPO13_05955 [Actinomycetota bacterium]|nr:MAG: hypothetical protein EPO13_05955 [Actinomycetota bacterium]